MIFHRGGLSGAVRPEKPISPLSTLSSILRHSVHRIASGGFFTSIDMYASVNLPYGELYCGSSYNGIFGPDRYYCILFVVGYLAIAFEHPLRINKSSIGFISQACCAGRCLPEWAVKKFQTVFLITFWNIRILSFYSVPWWSWVDWCAWRIWNHYWS